MFKISLQGLKSRCQLVWLLLETLEGESVLHLLTSRDIRHSLAASLQSLPLWSHPLLL